MHARQTEGARPATVGWQLRAALAVASNRQRDEEAAAAAIPCTPLCPLCSSVAPHTLRYDANHRRQHHHSARRMCLYVCQSSTTSSTRNHSSSSSSNSSSIGCHEQLPCGAVRVNQRLCCCGGGGGCVPAAAPPALLLPASDDFHDDASLARAVTNDCAPVRGEATPPLLLARTTLSSPPTLLPAFGLIGPPWLLLACVGICSTT